MIAIVDYGVGNLFSLKCSLAAIGHEAVVTGDKQKLERADRIILPGVGAFGDARAKLAASGLDKTVTELARAGKPLLGICLGMQMLFDRSYEFGEFDGLGLIPGVVLPIRDELDKAGLGLKIPHIGWNALDIVKDHKILRNTRQGEHMYFVHSFYAARCDADVVATTSYGVTLTAAVARDNVMGAQFHPEKSGEAGLRLLSAFAQM